LPGRTSSGLEVGLQRLIAQHIGSDIGKIEETEFIVQPQCLADRPIHFRRVESSILAAEISGNQSFRESTLKYQCRHAALGLPVT
jgi:hypothetical protein